MTRVTASSEWVATITFVNEDADMFYEAGGVYDHEPHNGPFAAARVLDSGERLTACPRCRQRFAATEDATAEQNRDLHFDGDEDIPSICRNFPTRRPIRVK